MGKNITKGEKIFLIRREVGAKPTIALMVSMIDLG